MAVNLSAGDVTDPELPQIVSDVLRDTGLEPKCLILEVTEAGMVRDTEAALKCLTSIRALGVRIAVDDFGTGYSSLSYLKKFPVDVVKIDRTFVLGLGRDPDATALVRGILSLTRTLGLSVVAEGIENDVQLEALRQLGCRLGQGYHWSPPVHPQQLPSVLHTLGKLRVNQQVAVVAERSRSPELGPELGWAVLDALSSPLVVLDADGAITATNLAWQRSALKRWRRCSDLRGRKQLSDCV